MSNLISIISTLYNYSNYVGDMIKSVLSQNYSEWELIIVDDGSTDDPCSVISKFKDDRIRYVSLGKNYGYSKAKNEGIILSKGQYITMIDADDMLTPNSLKDRYEVLSKSEKLWCHGDSLDINDKGEINKNLYNKMNKLREKMSKEIDLNTDYNHRLIHAQTIMVKRKFHLDLGLYDESLRFSSDNEMFRRAIRMKFIPIYCNKFVSIYRHHSCQMSKSSYKKKRASLIKNKIIENVEKRFKQGIISSNTRLLKK